MSKEFKGYCDILKSECTIYVDYHDASVQGEKVYVKGLRNNPCPIFSPKCPLYERLPKNTKE